MLVLTTVWTEEKSSCVFSKVNTHGICQKANSGIYSVHTEFHIFCPNVNYQKFQRNILDATTNLILGRRIFFFAFFQYSRVLQEAYNSRIYSLGAKFNEFFLHDVNDKKFQT